MRTIGLVLVSTVALVSSCGGGGGPVIFHRDLGGSGFHLDSDVTNPNPDLTDTTINPTPDMSMIQTGGSQSCVMTYNCYLQNQCQDQTCLDMCNAMAKTMQYATDAGNLLGCIAAALQGPCMAKCPAMGSTDMQISQCRQCLFGTVQGMMYVGGQCSAIATTCAKEQ